MAAESHFLLVIGPPTENHRAIWGGSDGHVIVLGPIPAPGESIAAERLRRNGNEAWVRKLNAIMDGATRPHLAPREAQS